MLDRLNILKLTNLIPNYHHKKQKNSNDLGTKLIDYEMSWTWL